MLWTVVYGDGTIENLHMFSFVEKEDWTIETQDEYEKATCAWRPISEIE